jgi:uncharacterized protein YlxW (UPF0749 family)
VPDAVREARRDGGDSLPDHVTTPLLTLLTTRSMDEDYAHVAASRRNSGGPAPSRRRTGWPTVAVVGLFGLLVGVSAVQTSRDAEVDELGRTALLSRIRSQQDEVSALQTRRADLIRNTQDASARRTALIENQDKRGSLVRRLEVPTGFAAVRGEGIRITLDNRPNVDPNDEIRDEDLAILVDGLWEAGAEAIAINDERLNLLGAIRNTSRAIFVNGRPVQAPYVVSAIGDKATLQARLLESSQGQLFMTLAEGLGFLYAVDNAEDLLLPAATLRPLRNVEEAATTTGGEEVVP